MPQKASIWQRPNDKKYWTVENGKPIKLYWSKMSQRQRELQIEAERHAEYIAAVS